MLSVGHKGELSPFAREAEPESPVSLGQGDAGEPTADIALLAQILAARSFPMSGRAGYR